MGYISKHLQTLMDDGDGQDSLRVVVKLKNPAEPGIHTLEASEMLGLEALRSAGLSANTLSLSTIMRVSPSGQSVGLRTTLADVPGLAAGDGVDYVRPMRIHRCHLNESIPLIGVSASTPFSGAGIRVAIVDSGIDHNHPDLIGRVNLGLSRNFTREGDGAGDVMDRNGHGTHVAGIVGGAGARFRGVAPGVEFIACKVFDATGRAEEAAISQAVRWAVQNHADVINYSGGFSPLNSRGFPLIPPPWVWSAELMEEEKEFLAAMTAGVVCAVSAGNDGRMHSRGTLSMPAICPDVISVGSVSKALRLSGFSSTGPAFRSAQVLLANNPQTLTQDLIAQTTAFPEVDLVAPGGEIDGTASCFFLPGIASALASAVPGPNDCAVEVNYQRMSGTSQAAPHVAGLSALVLAACKAKGINPGTKRAFVVKNILRKAATPIQGAVSRDSQGAGVPSWPRIEKLLNDIGAGHLPIAAFEV